MLTEPWVLGTRQRAEQTSPWGGWSKSNSWVFPECLLRRPAGADSLGKVWGLLKCRFLGPILGPPENLRGWDLGDPPFNCLHMVLMHTDM